MRQIIEPVLRIAVVVALVVAAGACSAVPTGASGQAGPDAARLNSNTVGGPEQAATSGVFIGGGMAAPVDTTSRGVFIGGGM